MATWLHRPSRLWCPTSQNGALPYKLSAPHKALSSAMSTELRSARQRVSPKAQWWLSRGRRKIARRKTDSRNTRLFTTGPAWSIRRHKIKSASKRRSSGKKVIGYSPNPRSSDRSTRGSRRMESTAQIRRSKRCSIARRASHGGNHAARTWCSDPCRDGAHGLVSDVHDDAVSAHPVRTCPRHRTASRNLAVDDEVR